MRNDDDKAKNMFIFLVILIFVVMILVACTLSGSTYGQLQTLYELAKHTPSQNIPVGRHPIGIGVDASQDKVYVSNSGDNTVSVINALNSANIGTIKVGNYPTAIGVDGFQHRVYIVNTEDNTVSVINSASNMNTPMETIKVGSGPTAIGVDGIQDKVYVANQDDNTVSVINSTSKVNTEIGTIKVGNYPTAIGVADLQGKVYVANQGDNTVSVINSASKANTEIGTIKVGINLTAIGVDVSQGKVYVPNQGDNTVSVINSTTDTEIGTIKVGASPEAIGIDSNLDKVYVANYEDNTVSVISSLNNSKIGTIKVGASPLAIGIANGKVYVANYEDNTVSVIDGATDKVLAVVTFTVNPFNAGHIECGHIIAPVAQQFYIWSGSGCTATPNQGFDFVSWQENLGGNSSRGIQFASPPPFYEPILDIFHLSPNKPEATLNITKFGSFTANFRASPPPIPPEYVATLFTVVITALVGSWLTPTIVGWRKTKKQGNRLDYYYNEVKKLYNDGKLDKDDIGNLDRLRENVADEYTRGKINKEQYDKLGEELSISYRKIFAKEIDSVNNLEGGQLKQLSDIRSNIEDTYASGKINDLHYANLKNQISILFENIFKQTLDSLNNIPENDKVKQLNKAMDDISNAYSKGEITELHYKLLNERVSKISIK